MTAIVSRQAAYVAANAKKLAPEMGLGRSMWYVWTSPAVVAWAQNDTMICAHLVPKGSRILSGGFASHGALTTSVTLDVGLVKASDGTTEYDLDGIASNVDVSAAGRSALNSGALVAAGVEHILTEDCYLIATLEGANPTDNIQLRIEIPVMTP